MFDEPAGATQNKDARRVTLTVQKSGSTDCAEKVAQSQAWKRSDGGNVAEFWQLWLRRLT